jgi:hypothetical protein
MPYAHEVDTKPAHPLLNLLLLLKVRKELPAPAAGELPLPSAASLAPAVQQQLAQSPGWAQLPWPQGTAPAQPQPHPQSVLDFKVRGVTDGNTVRYIFCWCETGVGG